MNDTYDEATARAIAAELRACADLMPAEVERVAGPDMPKGAIWQAQAQRVLRWRAHKLDPQS